MRDQLAVSAIITTHNRGGLVTRAVESALSELEPGDELLVINDGSTDATAAVLEPYLSRIRYFSLPGVGVSAARNLGIDEARGDLLAFLDDDDEWLQGKLHFQRRVMSEHPDVCFSFTNHSVRHDDGREVHGCMWDVTPHFQQWVAQNPGRPFSSVETLPAGQADFLVHTGYQFRCQLFSKHVLPSSLMVRCATATRVRFPRDLSFCEDWEYCARLSRNGPVAFLDRDFTRWHWHTGSRLTGGDLLVNSESRIRVLQRVWGQDAGFQATHGDEYRSALDEQHLVRARTFLSQARAADARTELGQVVGSVPLLYRASSRVPAPLLRLALKVRRLSKRGSKRSR